MKKEQKENLKKKKMSGVIDSVKMKDTAVVVVSRYYKHPRYKKFVKTQKRYKAHDRGNKFSVGDKVVIEEVKPISKDKKFKIVS